MTTEFVNGDIVRFKADRGNNVYRIDCFVDDKVRVTYVKPNGQSDKPMAEDRLTPSGTTYPHLITLAEPLMQFFRFGHLPQELQDRSRPFWELANKLVVEYPRNPERTVALRKLLEAKDAAVRSTIYQG